MFFNIAQVNNKGFYVIDSERGIAPDIIVEADSPQEANDRLLEIGVYLGYREGDCDDCCDERWHLVPDDREGTELPLLYKMKPRDYVAFREILGFRFPGDDDLKVAVHYKDGSIERY